MVTIMQQLATYLSRQSVINLPIEVKKIVAKEFFQSYILAFIYNHPNYRQLNFYGGTCARVIYHLNRLSEDIDLDNTNQVKLDDFGTELIDYLRGTLGMSAVEVHTQSGEVGVQRWTVKLPILFDLGLSPLASEKLHLKIEISAQPQLAQILTTPVVEHGQSYVARHFDLPSLMAGKIIACLERVYQKGQTQIYVKGRDYYDLIWYMQQGIWPDEAKLAKDGQQTYTVQSAFASLSDKVKLIESRQLAADILPLFPEQEFIRNWLEHFHDFYQQYVGKYTSERQ